MSDINKEEIKRLSSLARIQIEAEREEQFVKEFDQILSHFEELQELEAREDSNLQGTRTELRDDEAVLPGHFENQDTLIDQFPEKEGRYLKIPPIFDRE
ncbi:MAG: Asp-tRNA(Asn)/Glu-tRNA(Gln) amidotransferase subunit GatC [Candidatus Harrisonbacteria bacterium]|nr:Asp-tRNA(Asn)/Glu-tRNA(Gln) amidotransferase subunit GatC [Candidatus Harrisonbacteria bacterium]